MKKIIALVIGLPILTFVLAYAQPAPNQSTMPPANQTGRYVWVRVTNSLPKFDLKFPGGTPEQLVKAIEKATDKPLNTVIPDDCRDLKIPPFSVRDVTVAQLFEALYRASITSGHYLYQNADSNAAYLALTNSYGFRTDGMPNENSIWYFYWNNEATPQKVISATVCQFYQLSPYLQAGYSVDDITTGVETAWKMLGVTEPPALSYHKETKVLIAVGEKYYVNLIGDVLKQLSQGKPKGKPSDSQAEKSGK